MVGGAVAYANGGNWGEVATGVAAGALAGVTFGASAAGSVGANLAISAVQGLVTAGGKYAFKECYGASDALADIGLSIVGGVAGRNLGIVNALGVARAGASTLAATARGSNVAAAASSLVASGYGHMTLNN